MRFVKESVMSTAEVLKNEELRSTLTKAVNKQNSGILSHMSRGKWHMSKVILTNIGESTVHVELAPREKPLPLNIQIDQPIGLTFKLDFNKYICESVVCGLEPSVNSNCGGKIILEMPYKLEKMQKRSYYRVRVPEELNVKAAMWHRGFNEETTAVPSSDIWEGRLIDLSAGGLQIGIPIEKKVKFKMGQLIGIQFTPMPFQKPIILEGQIRHIAMTADERTQCLGVQIVGLEASSEGRDIIKRIVDVVEEYQSILDKKNKTVAV